MILRQPESAFILILVYFSGEWWDGLSDRNTDMIFLFEESQGGGRIKHIWRKQNWSFRIGLDEPMRQGSNYIWFSIGLRTLYVLFLQNNDVYYAFWWYGKNIVIHYS